MRLMRRMMRPTMRPTMRAAVLLAAASCALVPSRASAQRRLPEPAPSRADSLLARGRLFAAEEALYKAVDAAPRASAPRGELGRYLASRARFTIADVLLREALRFGADTAGIAQALAAIAPYRPEVDRRRLPGLRLPAAEAAREGARLAQRGASGAATVPMTFAPDGPIGHFEVQGPGGARRAALDSRVRGALVGRSDDAALAPRAFGATGPDAPLLLPELRIGALTLRGVEARVDPTLAPDEVRLGLDVLWGLQPVFDEVAGTLSIAAGAAPRRAGDTAVQVPFALAFPGMWLIPTVGEPPIALSSSRARALLRASRWWWDASQATLVVER